ncbi:SPW repeat domain-containing protein [Deinococcus aquiradiocola]|uniref:SPW repeat-containing integral membrane domain-containing protein n=1 Tax=Deinococcus aquiradiocola TaxID=393059 RepID=A0A917P8J9_9DEIO|nr:SPW repeat protein [Deinococcus aquiradiocola]GGJ66785.1 hypothetical protein GCM10008939_08720 [Deinococcus aquiradiocola]
MSRKWEDWITLVAGMWLLVAPNALGFGNVARTDAMWVGALILLVGLWALLIPGSRAAEWSALLLGLGLFLAPWVLNFSGQGTPAWNAWVIGALVAVLSGVALPEASRLAHPLRTP